MRCEAAVFSPDGTPNLQTMLSEHTPQILNRRDDALRAKPEILPFGPCLSTLSKRLLLKRPASAIGTPSR